MECFKNEKKIFQHVVCIHIEKIWFKNQQVSTQRFLIWTQYMTTFSLFTENGCFTSKKDMEKLS